MTFGTQFVKPIARIAKASLKTAPEYPTLAVASSRPQNGDFLSAARALAEAAAKYEKTFTDGGMAPDFLVQPRASNREGGAPVVIVSSSVARHFWPTSDPIGQQLEGPGHPVTVVGVAPDTRYRELQTARPTVYFPLGQSPFGGVPSTLLIRTATAPEDLVPTLRRAVASVPGVTLVSGTTLETLLDVPRTEPRLNAGVLALFAIAAMALAAIGLFAIMAMMVRQRTHELGIRLALGATAGDVRRLVMGRGVTLAAVGAALGLVGALATSRLLSSLLFEVSPTDPVSLLAVTALMLCVAGVATFAPAQSSMRIDPIIALRCEA